MKPSEVQKAVCTVTSGDVRASAEAFTTRELKGVCGSTEMLKSFDELEFKLSQELLNIRKLVTDLHRKFVLKDGVETLHNESSKEPIFSAVNSNIVTPPATFKFQPIPIENKQQTSNEISKNYYMTPKLKSLPSKANSALATTAREQEVSKYNNTLITNKDVKVYTYYWRMENFTQNIKDGNSLSIKSPVFSIRGKLFYNFKLSNLNLFYCILGKAFKITANFQHLNRDYLYLQLEDFSSSPQLSLGNSIILDTGGLFKEINSDNFKYKMSILDQVFLFRRTTIRLIIINNKSFIIYFRIKNVLQIWFRKNLIIMIQDFRYQIVL